jgi:gluconolactonase
VAVLGLELFGLLGEAEHAQQVENAATLASLEGPSNRDGNVYVVEMVTPRVMKLGTDGVLTTYRDKSNNANGLVVNSWGRLIAFDGAESNRNGNRVPANARITRTDLKKPNGSVGSERILYDLGQPRGVDGMSVDRQGNLYAAAGSATRTRGYM